MYVKLLITVQRHSTTTAMMMTMMSMRMVMRMIMTTIMTRIMMISFIAAACGGGARLAEATQCREDI